MRSAAPPSWQAPGSRTPRSSRRGKSAHAWRARARIPADRVAWKAPARPPSGSSLSKSAALPCKAALEIRSSRERARFLAAHDLHKDFLKLGFGNFQACHNRSGFAQLGERAFHVRGILHRDTPPAAGLARGGCSERGRQLAAFELYPQHALGKSGEESLGGVKRHDAAVFHHRDARAKLLGLFQVVGGENDRMAGRV